MGIDCDNYYWCPVFMLIWSAKSMCDSAQYLFSLKMSVSGNVVMCVDAPCTHQESSTQCQVIKHCLCIQVKIWILLYKKKRERKKKRPPKTAFCFLMWTVVQYLLWIPAVFIIIIIIIIIIVIMIIVISNNNNNGISTAFWFSGVPLLFYMQCAFNWSIFVWL